MTADATYDALKYRIVEHDTYTEYLNAEGQRHRTGGPAIEMQNGDKFWWVNGKLHRTDGPAVEWHNDGMVVATPAEEWYSRGKRHCMTGPAIIYKDGGREWWQGGGRHRTDGPAVELASGRKEWWVNGKQLTEKQIAARLKRIKQL